MANQIPEGRAAAAPVTTARTSRQSSLSTIKNYKDFRLMWMGNFVALGGQWIQLLTVGWLVLHLTSGNALLTGTVVAIRTLPVLIIGPWAGYWRTDWTGANWLWLPRRPWRRRPACSRSW